MSNQQKCSKCGATLAADVPGQLCPRCLFEFGLKRADDPEPVPQKPMEADQFPGYQIIQKIGEGGCGVVYRALQSQPLRREVAIKVIKLGMDTRSVITRFEAERQALALMDHPNIARVFDAGVTGGGRPFFVMELVSGERVTDYCDRKQLSVPQRLELFLQVCQAVQHAHQKGVIHRDLKPSNILVGESDGKPVSKVIDFGVAKAIGQQRLADDTIYTAFDQFVGTPAYMSPEQAGLTGEDIDTRSDIYSLGVLLYELLTGRPPFEPERLRRAAIDEICRIIREEEPVLPSARLTTLTREQLTETAQRRLLQAQRLVGELRGDLDWLVMKALEKNRERRYDTANGLASDILRHLRNEPIYARPPGAFYRFQKFTRRNRAVVFSVLAVSVALIVGTVVSSIEALHARRAEIQARREAATSAQVRRFLERMVISARPGVFPRQDVSVLKEIMDRLAREAKTEFTNQPDVLADLMFNLGLTYGQLNENVRAIEVLREAADAAGKLEPQDYEFHAMILEYVAGSTRRVKGADAAEEVAREALALRRRSPNNAPIDLNCSIAFQILADHPRVHGELDGAKKSLQELVDARTKKSGLIHDSAEAMWSFGTVLEARGEFAEAEATFRKSLGIQLGIKGTRDNISAIPRNYTSLGGVLRELGRLDEAEKMFNAANNYNHSMGQADYPNALIKLGSLYEARGQTNNADARFRAALALDDDALTQWPSTRVSTLVRYAAFRRRLGDAVSADALLARAIKVTREKDIASREDLLGECIASARSASNAGDDTGAQAIIMAALELSATDQTSLRDYNIGGFLAEATKFQLQTARTNEARQFRQKLESCLQSRLDARAQSNSEPSYFLIKLLALSAGLDEKFGELDTAEKHFKQAIQFARQLTYANKDIKTAYTSYASFLKEQKRDAEADVLLKDLNKTTNSPQSP